MPFKPFEKSPKGKAPKGMKEGAPKDAAGGGKQAGKKLPAFLQKKK